MNFTDLILKVYGFFYNLFLELFTLKRGKKIEPSGGRRENCWGISCEKSRFYAKKIIFCDMNSTKNGE